MSAMTWGRSRSCHSVRVAALRGSRVIRFPPEAGATTAVTSAPEARGVRCTGFHMRRAPAGIAATDFKGRGEPWEKGRTKILKVPRDALPTQPSGGAAL